MKTLKNLILLFLVGVVVIDIIRVGITTPSESAINNTFILFVLVRYAHVVMLIYIAAIYFNDPLIRLGQRLKKALKPTYR